MIVPVILAGGSGTRLWPLSRSTLPKQLLPLVTTRTMLQETILRVKTIRHVSTPFVICNHEHRFIVAEQLREIGVIDATVIIEPVGKNTAPAAAVAAIYAEKCYSNDPLLFILPSDHLINNDTHFALSAMTGELNALQGKLVAFGVKPTTPSTGYGYIKKSLKMNEYQAHEVIEFVEKPTKDLAECYVASGQYYWNSGMFMFKASRFLKELKQYEPDIVAACQKSICKMRHDLDFKRLDEAEFDVCPAISIDYAVMEKTENAVVIPLNSKWDDLGSWAALWEANERDKNNNVVKGDVFTCNTMNSYLHSEDRLMAVIGVSNLIIVETKDTLLVVDKDESQTVKEIVDCLKKEGRVEIDRHPKVYRPWGSYETIDIHSEYQVKRIKVNSGASLSLQSHAHRSEHWVVVKGLAEVTRGEEVFLLKVNESTYIPKGVKHRLLNVGMDDLEIIEVQTGNYLGEDDIVRYNDVYGRSEVTSV